MYLSTHHIPTSSGGSRPAASCHRGDCQLIFPPGRPLLVHRLLLSSLFRSGTAVARLTRSCPGTDRQGPSSSPLLQLAVSRVLLVWIVSECFRHPSTTSKQFLRTSLFLFLCCSSRVISFLGCCIPFFFFLFFLQLNRDGYKKSGQ